MANYFNTLSLSQKLDQLSKCRFMESSEFEEGVTALLGKTIVIVGCGAQGLNQGLNMRDSGLNISYAYVNKRSTINVNRLKMHLQTASPLERMKSSFRRQIWF